MQILGSGPHCARGHKYYGINKKKFEEVLTELIVKLQCKDIGFVKSFEATLINKYEEKESELGKTSLKTTDNIADLETEKLQKINAFSETQNKTIRATLEKQIEEIQKKITNAQEQNDKLKVDKNDIHAFIKRVKYLMEHHEKMLIEQRNFTVLRALFGLVFDSLPTYMQIVNGTPNLSLVYKLSDEFKDTKSFVAGDEGIEPPTAVLETEVIPLN